MPAQILVADDHEVVYQGISMILQSRPEWHICGRATNGAEAVKMAQELKPDAIIMDVTMPVMNGLEATRQISKSPHTFPVIVFTMHESPGLIASVQAAGGRGLVLKSRAAQDLIEALDQVLGGGTYFKSDGAEGSGSPANKREPGFLRFQWVEFLLNILARLGFRRPAWNSDHL
jgi:DNA-binding NarL/FixJ family response regulator